MKVLITGACSAKTFKILKAFTSADTLLADYGEVPDMSGSKNPILGLGPRNDDIIAHNLLNKCLDNNVTHLLPLHSFEVLPVAVSKTLFDEFNITVLLPGHQQLEQFLNIDQPFDNILLIDNGRQLYPKEDRSYNGSLSGLYYTDNTGDPLKLFTIE
ncbi:MAG: hypothetical protein EOP48_21040 [Sphingobacteriales bacterium]|nr:MAG: hypothetical protein EOP48_21040 [Sphingobacteriales bacterium]